MNRGKTVFAQLLGFIPFSHFEHLVDHLSDLRRVSAKPAMLLCARTLIFGG